MSVINRYIITEIIKFIFILLIMPLVIYLAVDFFENIEDFLDSCQPAISSLLLSESR